MAVEFTIYCDDCGSIIDASRTSVRAARATAQLQCGAVSAGGKDFCAGCRKARAAEPTPAMPASHSVGTQRP